MKLRRFPVTFSFYRHLLVLCWKKIESRAVKKTVEFKPIFAGKYYLLKLFLCKTCIYFNEMS